MSKGGRLPRCLCALATVTLHIYVVIYNNCQALAASVKSPYYAGFPVRLHFSDSIDTVRLLFICRGKRPPATARPLQDLPRAFESPSIVSVQEMDIAIVFGGLDDGALSNEVCVGLCLTQSVR